MRRSLLICVLMMTLSLSACGGGGGGSEAEELALTIRGEYLAMTSCAAQAVVTRIMASGSTGMSCRLR